MKFAPLPSTTPRVLAMDTVRAALCDEAVHLAIIGDPVDGAVYLSVGIGGEKNIRRLWLSRDEANELIRKIETLSIIL